MVLTRVRALAVISGRPVAHQCVAPWSGVGIVATIIFGGNGMRARDAAALIHGHAVIRMVFIVGWSAIMTPAITAMFSAKGTSLVRSERFGSLLVTSVFLAFAFAAQFPIALLFAYGESVPGAITLAFFAIAIQMAFAVTRKAIWVGGMIAGACVGFNVPVFMAMAVAPLCAAYTIHTAWKMFPERGDPVSMGSRVGHPTLALSLTFLLRLLRQDRTRTLLAAFSMVGGAGALWISFTNDLPSRPSARALTVLAIPICIGAALLTTPLIEVERSLRPLLRSTRTRTAIQVTAMGMIVGLPHVASAATSAYFVANQAVVAVSSAAWATALCLGIIVWARLHTRTNKRDPAVFILGVSVIALLATMIGAWLCAW